MGEKSDLGKKRMLLLLLLFAVLLAFVYVYVVEIVTVVVVLFVSWLAYDYIHDYTRESVEPAGRYVFITGCDTGFGLASAKAIRDLGFGVIAGCYDDNSAGAKELRARPWVQKVEVVSLDVTNEASVAACAKEVREICQDQGGPSFWFELRVLQHLQHS
ncbi:retinol dehydrogenase 16 [Aplysia californica]|uniref:Retinol dehydrogenase 16 n=1 Tax=Aplysia californica TaxID=6500 RepID=A0ABM0KB67_APLCA|nr:retinol dehydrogenase 16 [Aplysia californica]